jgi:hypothetical protein
VSEGKGIFKAAMHLLAHILVGTAMFIAIAAIASILEKFVHWLEQQGVSENLIVVFVWVEHLLFYLDISCFVIMLLGATYTFVREVWLEVRAQ